MTDKKPRRSLGFYILIALIICCIVYLVATDKPASSSEIEYSEVRRLFDSGEVESFVLEDNTLTIKLKSEYKDTGVDTVTHELLDYSIFYADERESIDNLMVSSEEFEYNLKTGWSAPWWLTFLPYLIFIILLIGLWAVMMNRSGMGGDKGLNKFGKARTKLGSDEKKKVTFADVAGADEEKEELAEIVDFLKNPQKYTQLGARIPKGVLLVGPPGTGKTLIAKATAGEANTQFLSISGSDFVEMYVGVGASRVRDLFDQAKKVSPCIIFIDEIDAVGRQRGTGLGGGHDEREQTLNQLLVEMDGFGNNEGVIVMAATNRADILDNALLRPGRFDRTIYVGLPDVKGREEILKVHAKGKMLGDDVDLKSIARGTPGFSGADLENLLNEAALLTARRNKRFITMAELDEASLKVIAGPEKKSRLITEKERKLTAYHEAGHAVASFFCEHSDPVHYITIIPRGSAGGMTVYRPVDDASFSCRNEMFERIVTALGGRVAEAMMLDDISTGASGDIQQASSIARSMVMKYGFSEKLGPISYDDSSHSVFIGRDFGQTKSYSEETAALIDSEVKALFAKAKEQCEAILEEHKDLLIKTAEYLLEHESMEGDDFRILCETGIIPPPIGADESVKEPAAEQSPVEPEEAAPAAEYESDVADCAEADDTEEPNI